MKKAILSFKFFIYLNQDDTIIDALFTKEMSHEQVVLIDQFVFTHFYKLRHVINQLTLSLPQTLQVFSPQLYRIFLIRDDRYLIVICWI